MLQRGAFYLKDNKLGSMGKKGDAKEGEDCVVGVGAAAIHWLLPCDGVTKQSVE